MKKIVLTGGIGSGKSTVATLFKKLGAPIIDADIIARELTEPGTTTLTAIIDYFGDAYLQADGNLDRKRLRDTIFKDHDKREWLEKLLHPIIRQTLFDRAKQFEDQPYCILVIPLLFESKNVDGFDRICVVDCSLELQIERIRNRDQSSNSEIDNILKSQADRETRLAGADDIITNDDDFSVLEQQVQALDEQYTQRT